MILRNGTSTKSDSYGKFENEMAQYLYEHVMLDGGNYGDDEWSDGEGEWASRYGRRILSGDDRGFVYCDTYPTEQEAIDHWESVSARREAMQDEVCSEQGCTPDDDGAYDTDGSSHIIGCERDWIA